MSLEDWKAAYRQLDPAQRKALAKWIVDQELGTTGVLPQADPPAIRPFRVPAGVVRAAGMVALLSLLAFVGWQGWAWKQRQEEEAARKTVAEREASEARKPRSPKNVEFLRQHVGREVTVTGIPEASEVGYLFFSKDKRGALRLNLMPAGVVLMQSGELEALVKNKVEITVTGVVEQRGDGALEIRVGGLGQLKRK
jgi:hypothetical protein